MAFVIWQRSYLAAPPRSIGDPSALPADRRRAGQVHVAEISGEVESAMSGLFDISWTER